MSVYKPMAESMLQILREVTFHLIAGVVPMRPWAAQAAENELPRDVRRRARRR